MVSRKKMTSNGSENNSSTSAGDEELYEVEKIVSVRNVNNTNEYLVRWAGWSAKWDTWEPEENLLTCQDLIEQFRNQQKQKDDVEQQEQKQDTSNSVKNNEDKNENPVPPTPADLNESFSSTVSTTSTIDQANPELSSSTNDQSTTRKRRRRTQRQFWQMVTEEEAAKLRDPFWKKVEDGNLEVQLAQEDGSIYERVKRGRVSKKSDDPPLSMGRKGKKGRTTRTMTKTSQNRNLVGDLVDEVIKKSKLPVSDEMDEGQEEQSGKESENGLDAVTCEPEENEKEDGDNLGTCQIEEENGENSASASAKTKTSQIEGENSENAELENCQVSGENEELMETTRQAVDESCTESMETKEHEPEESDEKELAGDESGPCQDASAILDEIGTENCMSSGQESEEINSTSPSGSSGLPNLVSVGQWLPMKPTNTADSKLIIAEPKIPTDQQLSTSTPAGETSSEHPEIITSGNSSPPSCSQATPELSKVSIDGLPLPLSKNISIGEFFKSEMRNYQSRLVQQNTAINSFQEFMEICCKGDVERVRETLVASRQSNCQFPIDVNLKDPVSGVTVLMQVCTAQCDLTHKLDDIIELLVSHGAKLNAQNDKGDTALMMAISKNQVCKVTKLVSLGAAINVPNSDGVTPLMFACTKNFDKIVYRLLDHGANFNAHLTNGITALDIASENSGSGGKKNQCEIALRNRADRVMQTFDQELRYVLPPQIFTLIRPLFPLHCYALNESNAFRIIWKFDGEPTAPSSDLMYLLAISKARFMSSNQMDVRFWGSTPVKTVALNNMPQTPITNEGKFIYSLWPIKNGINTLVITCNPDCKRSQHKLLIHGYAAVVSNNAG